MFTGKMNGNEKIVEINTLNSVYATNDISFEYNNICIKLVRVKNDINGNPMYHVSIYDAKYLTNITNKYHGKLGRYYGKQGYISVQSYNINRTLEKLLNEEM